MKPEETISKIIQAVRKGNGDRELEFVELDNVDIKITTYEVKDDEIEFSIGRLRIGFA